MAKNTYVGISGIARKSKDIYIGVNGIARKIKKPYIGIDGIARLSGVSATPINITSANASEYFSLSSYGYTTYNSTNGVETDWLDSNSYGVRLETNSRKVFTAHASLTAKQDMLIICDFATDDDGYAGYDKNSGYYRELWIRGKLDTVVYRYDSIRGSFTGLQLNAGESLALYLGYEKVSSSINTTYYAKFSNIVVQLI